MNPPSFEKIRRFVPTLRVFLGVASLLFLSGHAIRTAGEIPRHVENHRMIKAIQGDEAFLANQLRKNLEDRTIDPEKGFNYPYLYPAVAYPLGRLALALGVPPGIGLAAIILRWVCLLAALLSAWVCFRIGRKLGADPLLSLLSVALFFTAPDLAFWSRSAHPDTLQLLFISLAIHFLIPPIRKRDAILASVCAGLAFGTKYGGLFLLPFTLLPHLLAGEDRNEAPAVSIRPLFRAALFSAALFAIAFFLTNPTTLLHPRTFYYWIRTTSDYLASSDSLPFHPLGWVALWWRELQPAGFLFMAVGNSILLIRCARTWAKGRSTRRLLLRNLAAYGFFALIHLLFFVRTQEARYSHHIFPLLLAGAALGWTELLERTERRVRKLVLLSLFLSLPWFKEVPVQGFNSPEHASATLADGEALARIFPRTTRILSDCYVYIPPFIPAVQDSLGIRNEEIRRFKPDVLVFSRRMTGRWVWPEPGTSFEEGRWQTADKCNAPCRDSINLFSELRREGSPFRHHFTSERLIVLERK